MTENKWKSYARYCQRLTALERNQKVGPCTVNTLLKYWCNKIRGEGTVAADWERLSLLQIRRVVRSLDITGVLPLDDFIKERE